MKKRFGFVIMLACFMTVTACTIPAIPTVPPRTPAPTAKVTATATEAPTGAATAIAPKALVETTIAAAPAATVETRNSRPNDPVTHQFLGDATVAQFKELKIDDLRTLAIQGLGRLAAYCYGSVGASQDVFTYDIAAIFEYLYRAYKKDNRGLTDFIVMAKNMGLLNDGYKQCLFDYLTLGTKLRDIPNACRTKDNVFPVRVNAPMWWFTMTFNQVTGDTNGLGEDITILKVMARILDVPFVVKDPKPTKFPEACIVAYDENKPPHAYLTTIQCRIAPQTSSNVQEVGGLISTKYKDNLAAFFGGYIQCDDVDLIKQVQIAAAGKASSSAGPGMVAYDTFWIKAIGSAKDTRAFQPITAFEAAPPRYPPYNSIDKNIIAISNLGLGLETRGDGTSQIIARLNNLPIVMTRPFPLTAGPDQTWGMHLQIDPRDPTKNIFLGWHKEASRNPVPDNTPGGPITVQFWPYGTVYVGHDPQTRANFSGVLDEIIIDPSDAHS